MSRTMNDDNPITHQAIEWLSDLQDGKADSAALFRWLAESPRHVEEFAFALTLTDELAGLTPEQCAQIAAMNTARHTAENVVSLPGPASTRKLTRHKSRRFQTRRTFVAAATAAALTIGLGLWTWDYGWKTYSTDFGEQKVVDLQDGSTIHLNTGSRVKVRYGAARDIRLLSGEALFKVQRDPQHPFRVHADESVIQAVGTQFNVNRRATATIVSVLEGSVRIINLADVTLEQDVAATLGNLTVGQEAQIARQGGIVTRKIEVAQAAAWRQRRLVFLNDSLADIAAEFNRYNRRPQVLIEDDEAARKRFAASFDVDAPEALVQVLETNPELTVEQVGNEIRVRSRGAGK
jgi:transmembrane sensor